MLAFKNMGKNGRHGQKDFFLAPEKTQWKATFRPKPGTIADRPAAIYYQKIPLDEASKLLKHPQPPPYVP